MKIKVKITTSENMEFLNVKKDTIIEVEFEEGMKFQIHPQLRRLIAQNVILLLLASVLKVQTRLRVKY